MFHRCCLPAPSSSNNLFLCPSNLLVFRLMSIFLCFSPTLKSFNPTAWSARVVCLVVLSLRMAFANDISRRLARIRCLHQCISCLKQAGPLPESLCYVPDRVEYKCIAGTVDMYPKPDLNTDPIDSMTGVLLSRVIASGHEFCNNQGKWIRVKKVGYYSLFHKLINLVLFQPHDSSFFFFIVNFKLFTHFFFFFKSINAFTSVGSTFPLAIILWS